MYKLATNCKFTLSNSLYQEIDGCTRGGSLYVTFSDRYMVKLENDIVASLKPKFYRRCAERMFHIDKKI